MILSDEEISDLWVTELDDRKTVTTFARAIEAAILAKLASAELPEPAIRDGEWFEENSRAATDFYTADQLRQAYAQGAAAQLAEKPSAWKWRVNRFHQHLEDYYPPDDAYDEGTLVELYTRRQANDCSR